MCVYELVRTKDDGEKKKEEREKKTRALVTGTVKDKEFGSTVTAQQCHYGTMRSGKRDSASGP